MTFCGGSQMCRDQMVGCISPDTLPEGGPREYISLYDTMLKVTSREEGTEATRMDQRGWTGEDCEKGVGDTSACATWLHKAREMPKQGPNPREILLFLAQNVMGSPPKHGHRLERISCQHSLPRAAASIKRLGQFG